MNIPRMDGSSFRAALVVKRTEERPNRWAGYWAHEDGVTVIPTEGELSRRYFLSSLSAVSAMSRTYHIHIDAVYVFHKGKKWEGAVRSALKLREKHRERRVRQHHLV